MVWNVTKDDIKERLAIVEHHTWSPPLASPAIPPKLDEDRAAWSELSGVPVEAMNYSEFIAEGTWDVDDVLRPIYEEASEALGKEFSYPSDNWSSAPNIFWIGGALSVTLCLLTFRTPLLEV